MKRLIILFLFLFVPVLFSQPYDGIWSGGPIYKDQHLELPLSRYTYSAFRYNIKFRPKQNEVSVLKYSKYSSKVIYNITTAYGDTGWTYSINEDSLFKRYPILEAEIKKIKDIISLEDSVAEKLERESIDNQIKRATATFFENEKREKERLETERRLAKEKRKKEISLLKLGMSDDVVVLNLGRPHRINLTVGSYGRDEQWVYPDDDLYLYFRNGKLVGWQMSTK
jgi:hypothetical protein